MTVSRQRRFAAAVATALLAWGCAPDGSVPVSGSSSEATFKGSVTLNGKPATGGELVFDPSNVKRPDAPPRRATIAPDGTYTATTLIGENTVTIEGAEAKAAKLGMRNRKPVDVSTGSADVPLTFP